LIAEDDIVGQPMHHCYVPASVATGRLPAFLKTVRKPEFRDLVLAGRTEGEASSCLTSTKDIADQPPKYQQMIE
jgi:hypothetical protein